jgi:phenylacetate-CoA ligase
LYLETWLHNTVRNALATDPEYRLFANSGNPDQMARSDVEKYQFFHFRRTLQYAFERSSFYRERFRAAGVEPNDIINLSHLTKIPLTEPQDLADNHYRFLCLSQAEIARPYTFVTSGTTGPQKKVFWTQGDLERIIDFMSAGIGTVASKDDVVQIILPDGRPYSQSDLLYRGVVKLGASPVLARFNLSAREQLKIIEENHSTIVFGYVSPLFRLSKELESQEDLKSKGVKVLFLAAEYLPEVRRQELERIWNCRVHTHYGLTEMGLGVAVECEARNGYHFNEADLLLEIINPRTGEPVNAGEEGELVFTTLTREAMPLIRYRTHDISRLIVEPCPCGASSMLKLDKVKKRLESTVTIGDGDEVYPTLFDDVLFGIPGLIDYQITVMQHDGKERLHFRIEMISESGDANAAIKNGLLSTHIIAKNISIGIMMEPTLELTAWESLKSVSRAKKMILDRR